MALPWTVIETVPTDEGTLELRKRGERDFLIMLGPHVLMSSYSHRSEVALGELACSHLREQAGARVLVGGLGMGFTLRAVLDVLPPDARVVVAELNPVVERWCRGPLAALTGGAATDPRVTVRIEDVADLIREGASEPCDAIVLDLYRGPHPRTDPRSDPLYGARAVERARAALRPNGVFAVWGEVYDAAFDARLAAAGFVVSGLRPRRGRQHAVFVGTLLPNAPPPRGLRRQQP